MRKAHTVHVLKELSKQQSINIELLTTEIARLTERTRASFTAEHPVQPDIIYSK